MSSLRNAKELRAEDGLPSQEKLLLDYVERLHKFRDGRRAVHLHIHRLRPSNRRPHHLRIAKQAFDQIIQAHEGALFTMFNQDIVVVLKDASVARIDEVVLRLRFLFSNDPLLSREEDEARDDKFCTWYDLETGYDGLVGLADRMIRLHQEHETEAAASARAAEIAPNVQELSEPIDPERLAAMENALAQADLTNFTRRQAICAIAPGEKPQPVFREIFVSISDLRNALVPDCELLSNRWLFQYLTLLLDRRVIAMVEKSGELVGHGNVSINLNISSITSPDFLRLDSAFTKSDRRNLIIELQMIDVFAHMGRFIFARDFLHERGYRLCLDGCTYLTLPHVDREQLGFDFVKLAWSDNLFDCMAGPHGDAFVRAVREMGNQRVILNRCDTPEALSVGEKLGVSLYQGYYLDALLEDSNIRHQPATILQQH